MLLPLAAVSAPQLLLILNKTETQLGKPLRAELVAVDAPQKIAALDLRPLDDAFGVVVEESASNVDDPRWPGRSVEMLRLLLYPRQMGELKLPPLQLGDTHSDAQAIRVSEGFKGDAPITVATHVSTASPWERQQTVLQLQITTPDMFATLEAAGTLQMPGVDIVPLKIEREQRASGAVLRLGWVLSAQTAGARDIDLPPVRYNLSGRTERIYYFPKTPLHIRPLPPYIPPTMPVGKVSIASIVSPDAMLSPDTLAYWTVTVQGETVSPRDLPPVLRQVESSERVRFLSANSERTWLADAQRSQIVHRIPFKPLANGRLTLPVIHLQYFDPDTGRLARVSHTPPRPLVLDIAWRVVISGALSIFSLWLCLRLYRLTRRVLEHRRQHNAALAAIQQASDARQLRRALESVAQAEGFPANLSLREWAEEWRTRHRAGPAFDELMARLSQACYGKPTEKNESAEIKAAFDALYRR